MEEEEEEEGTLCPGSSLVDKIPSELLLVCTSVLEEEEEERCIFIPHPPSGICVCGGGVKGCCRERERDAAEMGLSDIFLLLFSPPTQPATVACKMEAPSEHVHVAFMFFASFGADLSAQSVLINKNFCIGAQSEVY